MSVRAIYPSGGPGSRVRNRCIAQVALRARQWVASALLAVALALLTLPEGSSGAETNVAPPTSSHLDDTNVQAILEGFLQLQQQIHATQLAIEENRKDIKEATAQQAAALSTSLQTIQDNFAAQRARDLEMMQAHNKLVLTLVSAFAAMGFLTMLMMSYFQWRMSKGLAEISTALPTALGYGHLPALAALGPREAASSRLIGASSQPPKTPPEAQANPRPLSKPNPIEVPHFPDPDTAFRRRQLRALRTAVIVGLICAAGLALLFYFVSYRKLGFGFLHGWFQS